MIKKIIGLSLILLSIQSFAQKNNASPYSFFGIGEETSLKTVEEISMGQIGVAFNSPYQISFSNPAALAHLRFTSYTLTVESKATRIDDGNNTGSASSTSLSYFAIGMPIGLNSGFSFGLQPNTTVGYSLTEEFKNTNGDLTQINSFNGKGGTNRVFLAFGYKLPMNLSFGIEGAYVFGSIENTLLNRRDGVQLATMHRTGSNLKGFTAKAGMQYNTKLTDKLTLKAGAILNFKNTLTNKGKEELFTLKNNSSKTIVPKDYLIDKFFTSTIKKPLNTALSFGVGEENKWHAAVEYSFNEAIEFTDGVLNNNTKISYENASRISIGGFYTPKINSISSYWDRITYRAGFNYKKTGLAVENTTVNDFGMSFGVGLPIGRQLSNLNLGFEFGKRGEINNSLIKENYFNFRLGLTLNDKWFIKPKIK